MNNKHPSRVIDKYYSFSLESIRNRFYNVYIQLSIAVTALCRFLINDVRCTHKHTRVLGVEDNSHLWIARRIRCDEGEYKSLDTSGAVS